jgi:hypothetical protein
MRRSNGVSSAVVIESTMSINAMDIVAYWLHNYPL